MNINVLRVLAVLFAFAVVYQPKANAEGYELCEILVHVTSYHTDRSKDFNERNYGLGLIAQRPGDRSFLIAGAYRNSIRHDSVYAGVGYEVFNLGPFYARGELVAVTGYAVPIAPAVVPEVGIRFRGVGLAVHYMPKVEAIKVSEVFCFSLTYLF